MKLAPRIICKDGTSLSVQASETHYCTPRDNGGDYYKKEVGYIKDAENKALVPPDTWCNYADGEFPSEVYGYVPVELIEEFIESHGGVK